MKPKPLPYESMLSDKHSLERMLLYRYTRVGCPNMSYMDVCSHPGKCAEHGCCIDLQHDLEMSRVDKR